MASNKPIALITGASSGIGEELARVFAEENHDLIITARRESRLKALAAELKVDHGTHCHIIPSDIGQPGAPQALFDTVKKKGLTVDVLVNNAGLLNNGRFAEIELDKHLQLMQVNIMATAALAHLFLQPMLARGSGRILNVSSISGFQATPRLATYAASKAFLLSLSESLWIECQGTGVTVTALCPGFTKTDLIANDEDDSSLHLPLVPVMTSARVARQGFDACMAGKPVYINGMTNRAVVELNRLQPGPIRRWLTDQIGKRGF